MIYVLGFFSLEHGFVSQWWGEISMLHFHHVRQDSNELQAQNGVYSDHTEQHSEMCFSATNLLCQIHFGGISWSVA